MNYVTVLNSEQLDNLPSYLEASEYVISVVLNSDNESICALFANGSFMQISKSYFEEMGISFEDIVSFDLSDDGQCLILDGNPFDLQHIWGREDDQRVIRSGDCMIV